MGSPTNGKHQDASIVLSGRQSIDYRGHSHTNPLWDEQIEGKKRSEKNR